MSGILKKLSLSFTLLIGMVVLILMIAVALIYSGRLLTQYFVILNDRADTIDKQIEQRIENIIRISQEIAEVDLVYQYLTGEDTDIDLEAVHSALRSIAGGGARDNLISRVILVSKQDEVIDSLYGHDAYASQVLSSEDYIEFKGSEKFCMMFAPGYFPRVSGTPSSDGGIILPLYCQILDPDTYVHIADMIVIIRRSVLFQEMGEWNNGIFQDIHVVTHDHESAYGGMVDIEVLKRNSEIFLTDNRTPEPLGGSGYRYFHRGIEYLNWHLVLLVSRKVLYQEVWNFLLFLLFLGALAIVFSFYVSYRISIAITTPVLIVTDKMKNFEAGAVPVKISYKAEDDLQHLINGYNLMVERIHQQLQLIVDEKEAKRNAELNSVQFELSFLQAQINPHFMHNSLNAVMFLAEEHGYEEVYEQLLSLNNLLRAAYNGARRFVSLREELSLLKDFVNLQKIRYGDTFDVQYEIPEYLMYRQIPQLTLQPIVENSIFHGIEPSERRGEITIKAHSEGKDLVVEVIDNGIGFREEDLEAYVLVDRTRSFSGIGLYNIKARLRLLYGEGYDIKLRREQELTVVQIRLMQDMADD